MELVTNEDRAEEFRRSLLECWSNEKHCDVVLVSKSDGKRIPAHRIVLTASCVYFDGMFASNMREAQEREITLDMSGKVLQVLVKYFYTDIIELHENHAKELFAAAHMWQLDKVAEICSDFLLRNLNANNCFDVLFFAESNAYDLLLEKTQKFIFEKFETISEGNGFLKVNFDYLLDLIQQDSLSVHNEEIIFEAIKRWVNYDKTKREVHKDVLVELVRLPLLKPEYLYDIVKPFCNTTKTKDAYYKAIEYQHLPSRRDKIGAVNDRPRESNGTLLAVSADLQNNEFLGIEAFCSRTNKWHKLSIQIPWRQLFRLAKIDENLIIVGGQDENGMELATVISIDIRTFEWKYLAPMNHARIGCGVAVVNGFLYVFGGCKRGQNIYSTERWDPSTNKWTELNPPNRFSVRSATVLDEKVYTSSTREDSVVIQSFCPKNNIWSTLRTLHEFYVSECVLSSYCGLLYLFSNTSELIWKCFSYDTDTNILTELQSGISSQMWFLPSSISYQNEIIGAKDENRLLKFNPTKKVWTELPSCNYKFVTGVAVFNQFDWNNSKIMK